ncbi:MAG: OmpA family protein [Hyphomicrobiales bacterium]|nr:OmpA family protein [Hyphomicrobiales bacterium]
MNGPTIPVQAASAARLRRAALVASLWLAAGLLAGTVQAGPQREISGRIAAEPANQTPRLETPASVRQAPISDAAPAKRPVDRLTPPASVTAAGLGGKEAAPLKLDGEFASAKRIVPFAFNKSDIGPMGRAAVKELLPIAKKAQKVYVRGRTDGVGNTAMNRKVAHDRAYTVYKAFRKGGIEQRKLRLTYCTQCFVAANDTEEGRRLNRRVEVEMIMPREEVARLPAPVHAPEAPPPLAAATVLRSPPASRP